MAYYHGTFDCLPLGTVLRPMRSGPAEDVIEKARPPSEPSRLATVFAVMDPDKVTAAGGADRYVYEILPLGRVTGPYDGGWFIRVAQLQIAEIRARTPQKRRAYRLEMREAAHAYWAKSRCEKDSPLLEGGGGCFGGEEWLIEVGASVASVVRFRGGRRIPPNAPQCKGKYEYDKPEVIAEDDRSRPDEVVEGVMATCRQCFEATRKQIEAQGRFWCPRGCVGPVSIPLARVIVTSQRPPNAEVPPFVKAIRAGTKLPPVVVQQLEDGRYEVQDGRHRVLACKRVGATHVLAFVQQRSSAREDGSRLAGMGTPITIAYEPEHACEEGCNCAKDSGYLDAVQQSLAELGSDDPAGDVARNAKYVRGAQRAKLEPKQAAAMILAMSQRDPADYQPRYRYEDVAEAGASEYVAVDHRGKKVFGPTRDYGEAKMHADRSGGVVRFEMGARESGANEMSPEAARIALRNLDKTTVELTDNASKYGWTKARREQLDAVRNERMALAAQYGFGDSPACETPGGASEGPHAQPFNVAPSVHACTVDSATAIAQQIPGGPWKYLKTYPKEAPARIERQQDYVIGGKTVTASFCGKYLLLRCPTNGTQYLFEGACIVDPAKPAPPAVVAVKGKPFTVRIKQGKTLVAELGPFAKITDAKAALDKTGKPGQVAGIYEDGKVADYRGDRAIFGFGRTRWSRA